MGDHFVLLVDRLITESTLEAAIESRNSALQATTSTVYDCNIDNSSGMLCVDKKTSAKLGECRICQDEDEVSNMETPCSCCGSLKYAHRRCVQRWCNEKGNTVCEICHQDFKPGYTAPPPLFQLGRIPMSFRGNWEISRTDLSSPQFVGMVATDRSSIASGYEEFPISTAGNVLCCRSVAIILMILLVLRHTLPLIISGNNDYSIPLLMLLLFRAVGIVVPIYFISRAFTSIQRHRQQRDSPSFSSVDSEDEETESSAL